QNARTACYSSMAGMKAIHAIPSSQPAMLLSIPFEVTEGAMLVAGPFDPALARLLASLPALSPTARRMILAAVEGDSKPSARQPARATAQTAETGNGSLSRARGGSVVCP